MMDPAVVDPAVMAISRREIIVKTAVVHTVTYFLAGITALTLLNYRELLADTELGANMRPIDHPMFVAGPLLQPIRGALFGWVFYLLRVPFFSSPRGWLAMWATLVVFGVVGTFGAPGGSLEGFIYTTLPFYLHVTPLPELVGQPLLLSYLVCQWVRHAERKWLGRALWLAFAVIMAGMALILVPQLSGL